MENQWVSKLTEIGNRVQMAQTMKVTPGAPTLYNHLRQTLEMVRDLEEQVTNRENVIAQAVNQDTGEVWCMLIVRNEIRIANVHGIQDVGTINDPSCISNMFQAFARCVGQNANIVL